MKPPARRKKKVNMKTNRSQQSGVGGVGGPKPLPTLLTLAALLPLLGCSGPRPQKGGHATTTGPVAQSIVQGDNPSQPTRQDQETIKVRTYVIPAGTIIEQPASSIPYPVSPISPIPYPESRIQNPASAISPIPSHSSHSPQTSPVPTTLARSDAPTFFTLPAPLTVTEREETRAKTELGAAQKDTAREFAAKLSSLRGIVWVGLALFIFGTASLVWPPLKALIGSVTTSVVITLGGIALMILPTLIVGNELLILGGVVLAVAIWFFAHRHGELRGQLTAAVGDDVRSPTPQQSTNPIIQQSTVEPSSPRSANPT
jgi:hypothetical protein